MFSWRYSVHFAPVIPLQTLKNCATVAKWDKHCIAVKVCNDNGQKMKHLTDTAEIG